MKSLGDAFEHGCFDGCNLTRADLANAYKLFGPFPACMEEKFKLEPEPEPDNVSVPDIGHTLCTDVFFHKVPTLGGNTIVIVAIDQKSGAILHATVKRKTAECVEEGIMRIVGAMNKYGHKVMRIVFDDEAVFVAMEERLAKRNLECTYTPAGKHNKRVERAIQELKSKMRCIKASLPYALPALLNGELMVAAMTAMNATPNTRSGPSTTPYELITHRKPLLKPHVFGQVGLCESRRADSPDTKAEWGIYMGATSNLAGHMRIYIPSRGHVYSRRSFKRYDSIPAEWNFKPRLSMKKEPSVWDQSTSGLEKTTVPGPNVLVHGGEKASDVRVTLTPSASEPLGFDDMLVRDKEKQDVVPRVVQQKPPATTQPTAMTDVSDSSSIGVG